MRTDETMENWEACVAELLVDGENFDSILADITDRPGQKKIVTQECATTLVQMASSDPDLGVPQLVSEESTRDQTVLQNLTLTVLSILERPRCSNLNLHLLL